MTNSKKKSQKAQKTVLLTTLRWAMWHKGVDFRKNFIQTTFFKYCLSVLVMFFLILISANFKRFHVVLWKLLSNILHLKNTIPLGNKITRIYVFRQRHWNNCWKKIGFKKTSKKINVRCFLMLWVWWSTYAYEPIKNFNLFLTKAINISSFYLSIIEIFFLLFFK